MDDDIEELRRDRERLEWLIRNGYTPARWRQPEPGETPSRNGLVHEGKGSRAEIDAAIGRQAEGERAGG